MQPLPYYAVSHQRSCCPCAWNFLEERPRGMCDFIWSQVRSMKKMLQRIKSCLEITWRRWYTVSRAPWKLLEEDVAMYQERLGSYLKKMLRCIKSALGVTWRRCYDVSRASWKLLEEDVTMYQERLGSYLKKMLQRSNVATSLKRRRKNVITLPPKHPIRKSDNSPDPRGAPPPQTSHLISWSHKIIWHHMTSYEIRSWWLQSVQYGRRPSIDCSWGAQESTPEASRIWWRIGCLYSNLQIGRKVICHWFNAIFLGFLFPFWGVTISHVKSLQVLNLPHWPRSGLMTAHESSVKLIWIHLLLLFWCFVQIRLETQTCSIIHPLRSLLEHQTLRGFILLF